MVENALLSQDFVEELKSLNVKEVPETNVKAAKFIEDKYFDYLQGKVEALIK